YSKADICINPMQDGTGLKIKTLEALAHGKWVVSTFEGGSGLRDMIGKGLYCSDDPKEWIEALDNAFSVKNDADKRITNTKIAIEKIYKDNLEIINKSLK
ncbi:MAG: glycosyltransferase family 4 protein, partial [Candidatus Paceibacterota bacterium]